jgi:hypothetical protein
LVEEGTLYVNGGMAGATIVNGGTLGGIGNATQVTINADGTLAPGVGIGTFTTQSLSFNGGTLAIEINTSTLTHDFIAIFGNLTLGANPVSLSLSDTGSDAALPDGVQFGLLGYAGNWDGALLYWQGSPLQDKSIFAFGSNLFRIDYGASTSGGIQLTSIPEPTTLSLVLAVTTLAMQSRRRTRRA